jgi:uncharacterized protein
MLIQNKMENGKGSFFIMDGENMLAEMTYTMPQLHMMIIDHTEVNDALRGKNVGYQLVHTAVEYARANSLQIFPLCPFANAVFRKKTEYADVLSKKPR